jgi:hypothetical protein
MIPLTKNVSGRKFPRPRNDTAGRGSRLLTSSVERTSLREVLLLAHGKKELPMLDNPEKTARLLTALKAAVPFEIELTPAVAKHLQAENADSAYQARQRVSDVSYAGDEGGIVCHILSPGKVRKPALHLSDGVGRAGTSLEPAST